MLLIFQIVSKKLPKYCTNQFILHMSSDDTKRIKRLVKNAIKEKRSKEEITATFQAAGIIDKNGKLRNPYKEIYIPAKG